MAKVNGTINNKQQRKRHDRHGKTALAPHPCLQAQHERPRGHDDRHRPDESRKKLVQNEVIGYDESNEKRSHKHRAGQIL